MDLLLMFANILAVCVAVFSLSWGALTFLVSFRQPTSQEKLGELLHTMRTGHVRTYTYPWFKRSLPGGIAVIWILSAYWTGNFL